MYGTQSFFHSTLDGSNQTTVWQWRRKQEIAKKTRKETTTEGREEIMGDLSSSSEHSHTKSSESENKNQCEKKLLGACNNHESCMQ